MALTESTMMPLGTAAPDFELPDPAGKLHKLADFSDSKVLVVAFICNHCPYVIHLKRAFSDFADELMAKDGAVIAINSNDATAYPDDSPERMAEDVAEFGYAFPYLIDERQAVAQAYDAVCTPDFFVFDASRALVYRGQFDGTRPNGGQAATGVDLRAAVEAVLNGAQPDGDQKPSVGCSIKWKTA